MIARRVFPLVLVLAVAFFGPSVLPALGAGQAICATTASIVPGKAVGAVTIGMPFEQALTLIGSPPVKYELTGAKGWTNTWYPAGPNAGLTLVGHDGLVFMVILRDSSALASCAMEQPTRI